MREMPGLGVPALVIQAAGAEHFKACRGAELQLVQLVPAARPAWRSARDTAWRTDRLTITSNHSKANALMGALKGICDFLKKSRHSAQPFVVEKRWRLLIPTLA